MRVKRLEVQGFKSFKDKTVVHFDHRITGIVGPNGCGKSNIVDAFFWVMGEQSYKHLRGSGSQDLIFNGSSKYVASGMAEATLVLETDYVDTKSEPAGASSQDMPVHLRSKEVSVTRRVYRGGEGEYFINGLPARLKDIQELFMDTGVGAKGYSVIEQGQIDRVVNSKPEDRRKLIEEAAGIAKYKARKKESLRKMEATQGNLARLNDVVTEIDRNLGSLERQAQKARKYKEYKEELFDKEMTWGRRKAKVVKDKIESASKRKETLDQDLLSLRTELQTSENNLEVDRAVQLTDGKAAEELQSEIQQSVSELTHEQSALELSRQRQGDLAQRLEELRFEKDDLAVTVSAEKEGLVGRESELEGLEERLESSQERLRAIDDAVSAVRAEATESRDELNTAKRRLMSEVTAASELNSKSARLSAQSESARSQLESVSGRQQELEERVADSESTLTEKSESLDLLASNKAETREKHQSLKVRIQETERAHQQAEREQRDAHRNLTQLRSRLESLEELAAAREGLGDGPKSVLDWAKSQGKDEDFALIADSFEVAKGFEQALEGWMENRLEDLFVTDVARGLEGFDKIRTEKQGRAAIHFAAQGHAAPDAASIEVVRSSLSGSGFDVVGALSEVVSISGSAKEEIAESARRLVRRVAVVRSLAGIASFLDSGRLTDIPGWSIVDLEGTVLEANSEGGYRLRGGSTDSDSSASLLGRKRAIQELKELVDQADSLHSECEAGTETARALLSGLRDEESGVRNEVQELEVEFAALEREIQQLFRALDDQKRELERARAERERVQTQIETIETERGELQGALEETSALRLELEEQEIALASEVEARDQRLREEESRLQEARIEEASARERTVSLRRELEGSRDRIAERERRIGEVERLLERLAREREQHTGGDSGTHEKIETLSLLIAEKKECLSVVRDRLEQAGARVNGALERIKKLHDEGDRKTAEANHVTIEVERLSSDLGYLVQNLEEKYGPGCLERAVTSPVQDEMEAPIVTAEMTAEEEKILEEEVERLRDRIRRLGEVNPNAVEEYDELKKRHDRLVAEKADLEKSIDNLEEAIEHINKTSEKRFQSAYEAIAQRFAKLFPIIFGGGKAELSLVYPEGSENILDAGVDILAQPPGKKVVNIGLLSGGEKALTAISLVFGIFMVKPSPFCLLDEVDAPLDDNNIGKFNALLREMSAKTQFIIITHNKKTMELNDTLYGVTMEEPGVSKVVSIELS